MTAAIEFDHVSKRFTIQRGQPRSFQEIAVNLFRRNNHRREEFWTLRDVSFTVQPGETVGIIGPNGVGKSTVLKLISRIIHPTSGRITTHGRIGALLELGAGFHPDLTGRENIYLNGSIMGMSRAEIERNLNKIIEFADIGQFIDIPVKCYSSGMYVRLAFSIAVHTAPQILLVDEVLAVGDAAFQHKCMGRIAGLRRAGVTIILVSHDLGTVQSLCKRAIWLEGGHIQMDGPSTNVAMAYLNHVTQKATNQSEQTLVPVSSGRRWGTGKVQITQVRLCDGAGTLTSVFVNGGVMEIWMQYWAETRIENPNFGLAIYHQSGAHICGPNTQFGDLYIPAVEGEGWVVYHIPSLALLEGEYVLSVAVVDRATNEIFDYHDRAYTFNVYPGRSRERYGLVTLNGEWRLEDGTGQPTSRRNINDPWAAVTSL